MEIKLNDGRSFGIVSYQKNSFEMTIPFNRFYDTAVLMTQKSVSNAKIVESSGGKETILYQFNVVKPLGFESKIVDNDNVTVRFLLKKFRKQKLIWQNRKRKQKQSHVL